MSQLMHHKSLSTSYYTISVSHFCVCLILLSSFVTLTLGGFNVPPIFPSNRDHDIYEDTPIGSLVLKARATDDDPLVYSIGQSNFRDGSKYFRIDSQTADVYLKQSLLGHGGEQFYFYVQAFDGDHKSKIEICVHIRPRNKNASKNSDPLQKLVRNRNSNQPVWPEMQLPKRPNSTWLISSSSTMTTTMRPAQPPPTADPLNNPFKRNGTEYKDVNFLTDLQVNEEKSSTESLYAYLFNPILPVLSIILFLSIAICFIIKCRNKVPNSSIIKTFSHKVISNNKSDSNETTVSTFSNDSDYHGALFQSRNYSSKEMHVHSNKPMLKVCENEWEFPRHHLKFIHILGEGCFGQVWKCEAINIGANIGGSQVVAVKTLKQNASEKEKHDLLEELEVMKMLDQHPNVITLMGCCTEQDPVLLMMEYIPNGTLQVYLRESRADYGNANGRLTSRDLISFAYQISKGMEYLSSKGVIHRDLAARNILVSHNKGCKIADFGFAKYLPKYDEEVYERKSEGRLPIRWMAVESLTDFIFTTKSDVWSFGILMWEIVTLGWTPYPGFSAAEVIKKVCDGVRLEKPEHCKREMFNIMYYCWESSPDKRPSFSELVTMLDNILYSENDYIELDRFPDHAYYNILKPGVTGEKL